MTNTEKAVTACWVFLGLCILSVPLSYWWTNTVPARPRSVSPRAVFLWAPHVGLPSPRRGSWLACWEDRGKSRCRLSTIDGVTAFEGDFLPYGRTGLLPTAQLTIDPRKTERAKKFFIGDALVPMVYLDTGAVLIPSAKYIEGKEILEREATQRRRAPGAS
jgi:hypothetical protein